MMINRVLLQKESIQRHWDGRSSIMGLKLNGETTGEMLFYRRPESSGKFHYNFVQATNIIVKDTESSSWRSLWTY